MLTAWCLPSLYFNSTLLKEYKCMHLYTTNIIISYVTDINTVLFSLQLPFASYFVQIYCVIRSYYYIFGQSNISCVLLSRWTSGR